MKTWNSINSPFQPTPVIDSTGSVHRLRCIYNKKVEIISLKVIPLDPFLHVSLWSQSFQAYILNPHRQRMLLEDPHRQCNECLLQNSNSS
ncbi:hypothetical protein L2E82_48958 [Cichorium intybus]|uniref:Uncharacterized protein n=1 Tax=Cichorium intybus TaxID=13427 RepID=A0ACB8YZV8_CICIN|nr:hypothetical protein L2E82_48958 [Cichorium intybus]